VREPAAGPRPCPTNPAERGRNTAEPNMAHHQ